MTKTAQASTTSHARRDADATARTAVVASLASPEAPCAFPGIMGPWSTSMTRSLDRAASALFLRFMFHTPIACPPPVRAALTCFRGPRGPGPHPAAMHPTRSLDPAAPPHLLRRQWPPLPTDRWSSGWRAGRPEGDAQRGAASPPPSMKRVRWLLGVPPGGRLRLRSGTCRRWGPVLVKGPL